MPSRVRRTLVLIIVVGLIVAGAATYFLMGSSGMPLPREQGARPSSPSPVPDSASNLAGGEEPVALGASARNELDCVDRLLQRGAPQGTDLKAEWDRCAALGEAGRNQMMTDDPNLELDGHLAAGREGNRTRP